MRQIVQVALVGLALLGSAALGFFLMIPVTMLAPQLLEQAAARAIAVSSDSRLGFGDARVPNPLSPQLAPLQVKWRLNGATVDPIGLRAELAVLGRLQGQGELIGAPINQSAVVRGARLEADAALVEAPLFSPEGQVKVLIDDAELGLAGLDLRRFEGRLSWENAALQLAERLELGRIEGRISAQDATGLVIDLTNSGSPSAVSGEAVLDLAARSVALNLLVTPRDPADPSVGAALSGLAKPEGAGFRIERRFGF